MFKRIFLLVVMSIFAISTPVLADTNGIWVDASDIRSGTFGSDETSSSFIFPNNLQVSGIFETNEGRVLGNEGSLKIIGVDHSYVEFYPQGLGSGRKAWLGYGSPGSTTLILQSQGGNLALNPTGQYVGIGTQTPGSQLEVDGTIAGGDIYSNGNLVATQDYVDANDDVGITTESDPRWNSEKSSYATKSYVDSQSVEKPSLTSCNDGDALIYSSSTNSFYCGAIGGGGGTPTEFLFGGGHTVQGCTDQGGSVEIDSGDKYCKFARSSCPAGWGTFKQWTQTTSAFCSGITPCSTGEHSYSNTPVETCTYLSSTFSSGTCVANVNQIGCI